MTKGTVISLGMALIFVTCQSNYDRKNHIETASEITKAVIEADTTKIRQLVSYNPKWNSWNDMGRRFYLASVVAGLPEAFNALHGKHFEIIRLDTASERMWDTYDSIDRSRLYEYIDVIIKEDTTFHGLKIRYGRDSLSNIYLTGLSYKNLSKACLDELSGTGQGHLVEFKEFIWSTNPAKNTFTEGKALIKNNANYKLHSVKLRVVLKDKNSNEFVNQTITYNKPIGQGDLAMIDLPGLKNYYAGRLLDKSQFVFVPELIEALPRNAPTCMIIEGLSKQ